MLCLKLSLRFKSQFSTVPGVSRLSPIRGGILASLLGFSAAWSPLLEGQVTRLSLPAESERFHYHTPPSNAPPEMAQQHTLKLPSLLIDDEGNPIEDATAWYERRRPELVRHWTRLLGKLSPSTEDQAWFGDIGAVKLHGETQRQGYRRLHLSLPMERDFFQPHLLLLPEGQGEGPFPVVIAWTSTTPDYQAPEDWWGASLARQGYAVLTGWSFIRNYRDGTSFRNGASEKVYERFGHWLPMAKMVHDVQREIAYLRTRPEIDADRIGFMGFSLSAKAALYVAAFAPEVKATVSIDPHLALHGATNWHSPWYLDWNRRFPGISSHPSPHPQRQGTVWSLLDADPKRPGFERNHHEVMALCAPRALMVIALSNHEDSAPHSDDRQSWAYANRTQEVYDRLGIPEQFAYVPLEVGHQPTSPAIDAAWQRFLDRHLKNVPIEPR